MTLCRKENAILFVTHEINPFVLKNYYKLKKEASAFGDVFLLLHKENSDEYEFSSDVDTYIFNISSLNELGYVPIAETIIPGSNHFVLLQFFLDFPHHKHYWNIEYDVSFTGSWTRFFEYFIDSNVDFFSSHIKRYKEIPNWYWWGSLSLAIDNLSKDNYIRSFNPIYRISNKALCLLDKILKAGNRGHHEVLIPTVLNLFDLRLSDFGGNGEFVSEQDLDRFYLSSENRNESEGGTMRFRPVFKIDEIIHTNILYHPVKNG